MKIQLSTWTFIGLLSISSVTWATAPADPYSAIEHIRLENGLNVYLAPSSEATLTSVRLNVDVGTDAEVAPDIGVSHLLEHVLFRDKDLQDEMSYLQLIRESGGSANGTTTDRQTSYFGSIPSKKGTWLLETFGKMLLEPKISDNYVMKEKSTIELERGRPSPLVQMLRFDPMEYIYIQKFAKPSFWESEFNLPKDKAFSLAEEQLSTQQLTTAQVKSHYDDYYYPSNMQLFVAGKFNRDEVLKIINSKWASLPSKKGKTLPEEPTPSPRRAPYVRYETSTTPGVSLGVKLWQASIQDEAVIKSYMQYLAHRMMKEIRNVKGQTYSASEDGWVYKGFGYSLVSFQTPKESFSENLQIAKEYLDKETTRGEISEAQVKEAKDLYLSEFHLNGKEADSMMSLAQRYSSIMQEYGTFTSPYSSLEAISPEAYKETLKKFFIPSQKYEYIAQPPLFFHYDKNLVMILSLIFCFALFRYFLTQEFSHDKVQWVRKIQYPPLKILEGLLLLGTYYLCFVAQFGIDKVFASATWLQSHVFFSEYIYNAISMAALLAIAQGMFSLFPRKVMVHNGNLLVKSVTYYSFNVPLSEIQSVEAARIVGYPFPLARWVGKVKHRCYAFSPNMFRKGLLVNLKDGRSYYFGVTSAEEAKAELEGILAATQKEATKASEAQKAA